MIRQRAKSFVQKWFRFGLADIQAGLDLQRQQLATIQEKLEACDFRIDRLKALVKNVEHYQPVYGLTGIVDRPARQSDDRCAAISDAIGDVTGMRILDIGSSLGYVSFYFADRGAVVEAWEASPQNAEVARLIQHINGIPVRFVTKHLSPETAQTIPANEFDVVIVLSVFHHIIRFQGLETTKAVVAELMHKCPMMFVELAKKGEDAGLPWDKSQPEDELAIFQELDVNITKIGAFPNHLSDKTRPLYKVEANKTVTVNGTHYVYTRASHSAYDKSPLRRNHELHRKYYFSDDYIIKEYGLKTTTERHFNIPETYQELGSLYALSKLWEKGKIKSTFPEIYDYEIVNGQSRLVFRRLDGTLLSDLESKSPAVDEKIVKVVLRDVLGQLADMHANHLYHNDVQSWNIIVNDTKALLIDFGHTSQILLYDDVTCLVWAVYDFLTNSRETDSTALPPVRPFTTMPTAAAFYELVKQGNTDAADILCTLKLGNAG